MQDDTPLERAACFAGCTPNKMRNFLRYLADHAPRLNIWRVGFARLYRAARRCSLATIMDDRFVPTLWGARWTLRKATDSPFEGYAAPRKEFKNYTTHNRDTYRGWQSRHL